MAADAAVPVDLQRRPLDLILISIANARLGRRALPGPRANGQTMLQFVDQRTMGDDGSGALGDPGSAFSDLIVAPARLIRPALKSQDAGVIMSPLK